MQVHSIVFEFIDHNGEENISIWNWKYFNNTRKNIRELVWYIGIEQTEEDLQKVLSLQPDEMLYALMKFKELHSRSVFYPN